MRRAKPNAPSSSRSSHASTRSTTRRAEEPVGSSSAVKPSLRTKLDQLSARLAELDALLASEEATRDLDRYRTMSRERAEIDPVVARFGEFGHAEADLAAAVE